MPVTGDRASGEPCIYDGIHEATDNCDETSACWDLQWDGDDDGDGAIGTCRSFCMGTPIEEIGPGEPCGHIQDCAGGLMCIGAETLPNCDGSSCCTPFCDLELGLELGGAQCDAVPGTVCVAMFQPNMAPFGYQQIGRRVAP